MIQYDKMELIDALKTIEVYLRPGISIELWMMSTGQIIHKLGNNESDSFFSKIEEFDEAIKRLDATT